MSVCQAERSESAFEVDLPSRCAATTAILKAQARRASDSSGVDEDTEGALLWSARLNL